MTAVNVRVLRLMLAVSGGSALLAVGAARGATPSPDPSPVAGPTPDPFPARVHVQAHTQPSTTAPAVAAVAARAPAAVRHVTPRRPRHAHRVRPAHHAPAPVEQLLRIPDHPAPVALGAFDLTGPTRRVPLAVVVALSLLTLASGVLVVTVARARYR